MISFDCLQKYSSIYHTIMKDVQEISITTYCAKEVKHDSTDDQAVRVRVDAV